MDTSASGLGRQRQVTNTGQPEAVLSLSALTPVGFGVTPRIGRGGCHHHRLAGAAHHGRPGPGPGPQAATAALALAAECTKAHEQFGEPIATFQPWVGRGAADAYIDTEAIRLTASAGGLEDR